MSGLPLLALVGSTASGKTDASIVLALALDAEIVSCDSTLVYRGMDAGTAKPSAYQRAAVPHHVVDVVEPVAPFTVHEYQRRALEAIASITRRGRTPLLVGASGLYYRSVVDRLEFPGTRPGTRALLEAEATAVGGPALHARLASFDPEAAARIEPTNARRAVRALEVAAITGRRFSSYRHAWDRYPPGAVVAAGVDLPREALYARIEERATRVMPALLAETAALLDRGYARFVASPHVIGYAEAAACLRGDLTEAQARDRIAGRVKALARRQLAWFRRDPRIRWFRAAPEGAISVVEDVLRYLRGGEMRGRRPAPAGTAGPGA